VSLYVHACVCVYVFVYAYVCVCICVLFAVCVFFASLASRLLHVFLACVCTSLCFDLRILMRALSFDHELSFVHCRSLALSLSLSLSRSLLSDYVSNTGPLSALSAPLCCG
jgi:hypothetical protein